MPIPTPADPQAAALLAHVLTQTTANINFLASQNYITPAEASDLISRLSQSPNAAASTDALASSFHNLAVGPARTPEPARRVPPPPARNNVQKARAVWAYNEDGRVRPGLPLPADNFLPLTAFRVPPYRSLMTSRSLPVRSLRS